MKSVLLKSVAAACAAILAFSPLSAQDAAESNVTERDAYDLSMRCFHAPLMLQVLGSMTDEEANDHSTWWGMIVVGMAKDNGWNFEEDSAAATKSWIEEMGNSDAAAIQADAQGYQDGCSALRSSLAEDTK